LPNGVDFNPLLLKHFNMTFEEFVNQGWMDHGTDPTSVAARLPQGTSLIHTNEQIATLTHLAVHVYGEHLGQWDLGISFLKVLTRLGCYIPGSETENAIQRGIATLEVARGPQTDLRDFTLSDQIRVCAVAASALSGQGHTARASELFVLARQKANEGIPAADPANRALAVTGNNLALSLEEKSTRSSQEVMLMQLAAHTARMFWEIAGTWLHVERAEYRLATTYMKSLDYNQAIEHAENCLKIVTQNKGAPEEYFFAYEIRAKIERAHRNALEFQKYFKLAKQSLDRITDASVQPWCQEHFENLNYDAV
jgi:tetratricopeptide (TPR) repeat protein